MGDDRPLENLTDEYLERELVRLRDLAAQAANSLGEVKTEIMRRAIERGVG